MAEQDRSVVLKDATMREGLDVPGVALAPAQRMALARLLDEAGVPEVEFVAPGRFEQDMEMFRALDTAVFQFRSTGLIWAAGERFEEQVREAQVLDRIDLLMPLSTRRPPTDIEAKIRRVVEAARAALEARETVGVGFPHATQVTAGLLEDICGRVAAEGVQRITLYDTNGSADPFDVLECVRRVRGVAGLAEIAFHAHNDLGMATANSIAAVRAGATCLDVTVNGLGDRAGNASLEQVVLALLVKGAAPGILPQRLRELSQTVESMTGIKVSPLAPVVGAFAFKHKSPNHLGISELFEAYDPSMIRATREEVSD